MRAENPFLEERRNALETFVKVMLPLMLLVGLMLLMLELKRLKGQYLSVPFLFHLSVVAGLFVLYLIKERIQPEKTMLLIGIFLFADTGYSIISYGIEARSFLGIGYLCIFVGFVFGMRWGVLCLFLSSLLLLLKGILLKLGYLSLDDYYLHRLKTLEYWAVLAFSFLFYPLPLIFLLYHTKERLRMRIEELSRMGKALNEERREKSIIQRRLNDIAGTEIAGFFILDEGKIREINRRGREILGLGEENPVCEITELVHPQDREGLLELLFSTDDRVEKTLRILTEEGIRYVLMSVSPGHSESKQMRFGILIDVTREKLLEAELQNERRGKTVADLVRGIGHDFNNALTAIEGYASILKERVRDRACLDYANRILLSCQRAKGLIKELILFGKREPLNLRRITLNGLILTAESIFREVLEEDTEVVTVFSDQDVHLLCDPDKMQRVFLNLATNARDAMEESLPKRVIIRGRLFRMGRDFIEKNGFGNPGLYASISVSDTGCGMNEEILRSVFKPFFTTKERGKGTGLGLSIVYSIIKDHGGYITVESEPGRGSTFYIYLRVEDSTEKRSVVN